MPLVKIGSSADKVEDVLQNISLNIPSIRCQQSPDYP